MNRTITWCAVSFLFFNLGIAIAQEFVETAKLSPTLRHREQRFGGTVSISGDYAIVSARHEEYDINEENPIEHAGAAYIYEKENGNWIFKQKLVQEHRWFSDEFGVMVSIEGDYAVVGIHGEDLDDPDDPDSNRSTGLGAAMIYKRGSDGIWNEHQLIHADSDGQTGEQFGFPIKIKEDVILVGAIRTSKWQDGEYLARIGSVYVFEKNQSTDQWVKVKKLMPSDGVGQDQFGKMVDLYQGTIIIGANLHEPNSNDTWVGAAYVFNKNESGEWVETQKLDASNKAYRAQFGESVAITQDFIFVGAPGMATQREFGYDSEYGAVYVFKKNTEGVWEEVQYIIRDDFWTFDEHFGQSISAFGNKVAISANRKYVGNNTTSLGQGFCYLYEINTSSGALELIQTIVPENHYSPKEFGLHVIMNGTDIIIGDESDNGGDQGYNLYDTGAAHIFELPEVLSTTDLDNSDQKVPFYPNPAKEALFISATSRDPQSLSITDIFGRRVYHTNNLDLHNHRIDLNFAAGTYFLSIDSGSEKQTYQFIKQ